MKIFEVTYPHSLRLEELPDTAAAIGFFDGIHRGHRKLIHTAKKAAEEKQMESAVITFHPHPSAVLKKDVQHVEYITPLKEKKKLLQQMDVDRMYIITFNRQLASLSPGEFISHFIDGLNIKHIVGGFDYTFGHKGKGNMETMKTHAGNRFEVTVIDKVEMNQEKVSSTKIRELMKEGKIEQVNALLNRPLSITGTVVKGDQRGRTIGYPTANLQIHPDTLMPKPGVYAVKALYKNEEYEAMANLGVKPTFTTGEEIPSLEVHLFDYNNDIYGEELRIEWHQYIRDEVRFNGVDELITQLQKDEQQIRNYFSL
ncbi:riboflavin biosynthesis protein RibF [Virgibacillus sp. YIM 98842]|jgi:riboflavin kinase/FMN adenylyltransferase|uniref:riboflavin biosynthesis protein RibF n=1 Tax=Virgibacillus sp. YIM 98842 TaxID=2663533 RepID=UPI0013DD590F|nr:riboflavin biosynthesis protein RibF [Virgibacillus sp. YIM 98842]